VKQYGRNLNVDRAPSSETSGSEGKRENHINIYVLKREVGNNATHFAVPLIKRREEK